MAGLAQRRSIRIKKYDYSSPGAYFVTISVQNGLKLFGQIAEDCVMLNPAGIMIEKEWLNLPDRFPLLELDEYVIMPDHFHGILCLMDQDRKPECNEKPGEHEVRPYGTTKNSVGRIIQSFKSRTTVLYGRGVKESDWPPFNHRLWQRSYYEHVLRNQHDLDDTREYIKLNPRAFKNVKHGNLDTGIKLS